MSTTRKERLDRLRRKQRVAVLVVGGGINGISTYRELALQGVDALLVERGDFMSGCSAAPSRMIHGGLRYMENGEFGLVKESLLERNRLLKNAPHYVSPLPTLIPLVDRFSGMVAAARRFLGGNPKPGVRGALIVKLGLTFYDIYAGRERALPRSSFFGRRATRANWPAFNPDIDFAALYYDAKISYPERLGVELVLDVERDAPQALALNHLAFAGLNDGVASVTDSLTGEKFEIRPDVIVNATGAWTDLTNALAAPTPQKVVGGTKGSHLMLRSPALVEAIGDKMVYFANRDGRVCILFVHFGNVLAGSTDISVETPEGVRCEPHETDYILRAVREMFPGIAIGESDIIYRFSGVRPLPRSEVGITAAISRDHRCEWLQDASAPVLSLIGGKWTTFRAFGAEAADLVLDRIGRQRKINTQAMPIGCGATFPRTDAQRTDWVRSRVKLSGLSPERVEQLLQRYGGRSTGFTADASDTPLAALPSYSRAEIEWLVENEHVVTLADLVLRRTAIAFTGELSLEALEEIAALMARPLGWNAAETRRQVDALVDHLTAFNGLDAAALAARNIHRKEAYVPDQESAHEPAVRLRKVP